jgi:4-amino-4-deoxy-L-arabinose transferase-like glycosyltransferase
LGRKRGRAATATSKTAGAVAQTAPAGLPKPAASGDGGSPVTSPGRARSRSHVWLGLAVAGLLLLHYALAARSLLGENPTIDEVVHLPAGVTYWQRGTFRLYHHNPPLVKLVAALPVVWSGVVTAPLYESASWTSVAPSQAAFGHLFAALNAERFFELFQLARLMMPLFSVLGGLVVFEWSRRLYGTSGGFLSLALWVFCPNVLAHGRLITTDMGSTSLGVAATFAFWLYLQKPGWRQAVAAGVLLGLAELTKFSMLLLYAVWPFLWLCQFIVVWPRTQWLARARRGLLHGAAIVAISFLTIDAGYLFEGVGKPLGWFEFGSRTLTTSVSPGMRRPHSPNPLLDVVWQFRVNRFRGTWLAGIPCPLPEHYVLGFDEQKIETEGVPRQWDEADFADKSARERAKPGATDVEAKADAVARLLSAPEIPIEETEGYPVYLNGDIRRTGWWYYFPLTLAFKVPEGTWILILLSLVAGVATIRSRAAVAQELLLCTVPAAVLFSMSFLTDINIGLRYVLAIFPYAFIATGKVVPWILAMNGLKKRMMGTIAAGSLALVIAATALIHPHYLAYFNWASGGPDRVPPLLIDSNLDWGQDLVSLQRWCKEKIPGEPIGLAYFGQINPSIFAMRGEPFPWFLAPVQPGTTQRMPMASKLASELVGPARRLEPGYYAVSVSSLYGLPWRFYDPAPVALLPAWNASKAGAFSYFRELTPIRIIGHSINVYRLNAEHAARLNSVLGAGGKRPG